MYPVINPDPSQRAKRTLFVDAQDLTAGLRIVFGAPKLEQLPGEDSSNHLSTLELEVSGSTLSIKENGNLLTLANSAPATTPFNISFLPGGSHLIQYAAFGYWVTHNLAAISGYLASPPSYGLFFLRHDTTGTAHHIGRWRVSSSVPAEYACFSTRSGDSSPTSNGSFFIAKLTPSRTFDLYISGGNQIFLNVLGFIP